MGNKNLGDRFQQEIKYVRGRLPKADLDWANKPETFKRYPEAPQIKLSEPKLDGGIPLWRVIRERRSQRQYKPLPIEESQLSQMLWASQGITGGRGQMEVRAAPSAGALYPVETYLAIHRVEAIDPGVYHYDVRNHALECLMLGTFAIEAAAAALDQRMAATASVVFMWTAIFPRAKWKYKQRAYRYVYLDAGHIAQNLALAAVGLGLVTCQIAALYDDEVNSLLGVDGIDESILYMSTVGRPY